MSLPRNFGNALAVDLFEGDFFMEGEAGEDGELVRGVVALDVGGRILFGVAERLRLFQGGAVVEPFLRHAGEDVVGGAVDDAGERCDDVRLHPVDEGADDGHAADAARFEIKPRVGALRRLFQLVPVLAEQLFVGGDDRLAAVQRREDEALCRFDAADDLDNDVDVRIADDLGDVAADLLRLDAEGEGALAVDLEDALHVHVDVLRAAVKFPVFGEDPVSAAPHDSQAENGNADCFHFLSSGVLMSYRYFSPCKVSSLSTWSMQEISRAMISLNPPVATTRISGSFISRRIFLTIYPTSPAKPNTMPACILVVVFLPMTLFGVSISTRGSFAVPETRDSREPRMPGATAPPINSPLFVDDVERRSGAEVDDDERRAVLADRRDVVDDAVGAHLARVVHAQVVPRFQPGADHERLDAEVTRAHMLDGVVEGGNDGRDDGAVHRGGRNALHREHIYDRGAVLVAGALEVGRHAEADAQLVALEQTVFDVGVADVDAEDHCRPPLPFIFPSFPLRALPGEESLRRFPTEPAPHPARPALPPRRDACGARTARRCGRWREKPPRSPQIR